MACLITEFTIFLYNNSMHIKINGWFKAVTHLESEYTVTQVCFLNSDGIRCFAIGLSGYLHQ